MQKKLIALALASLAGTAFAQSNVTIYGVADATFDNVKATAGNVAGGEYKARNRVSSNSSYIGFKGVEDLGNGLKAAFQFETGVTLDQPAGASNAGGIFNGAARDSYVGLAGGFGTVVAGYVTGPTRALGAKLDVNSGATGIGANTALIGKLGGNLGGRSASAFDTRIDNAIAYISPNFSGFSGVVAYSTGFTAAASLTNNGAAALATREGAGAGPNAFTGTNTARTLGLNYENGPIYAGYAYTRVVVDGSNNDLYNNRIGGIYKFGTAGQVGLLWDQTAVQQAVGGTLKQNTWYLSGKFNVTPAGAVIAQYGRAGDVKNNGNLDEGANHYVLGYEHSLSKRTVVKALYSAINNKRDANYDFFSSVSTTAAGGPATDSSVRGFSVGVRHSF